MFKKILLLIIVLVSLLSISAISATDSNADSYVVAESPGNFNDLQDEINAAYESGELVLTKNYTNNAETQYANGVAINSDLTIDGKGYTIDAKNNGRIFKIASGVTVTLKNINFINGQIEDDNGGAIYSYGGSVIVSNSSFTNTTAEYSGGAIYIYSGTVIVTNSSFTNTTAEYNGGAIFTGSCSATVTNSTFTNTTAARNNGGAISISYGRVSVINSSFKNNSANGNGASIYSTGTLNIKDSTFNSSNTNGTSIIYIQYSYVDLNVNLTNNTIESNLIDIYNYKGNIISPTYLTFDNVTAIEGKNATLTATLKDDNGNIIGSNTPVTGNVNGTNVNFVFDDTTGKFTGVYNETTAEGEYIVTGTYSKATNINVINGTLTVKGIAEIYAPSIVKYYKNGTQFIVKVTDSGAPVVGSHVEITLNGVAYNRTTDIDGVAKLNINLAPGEYDVNVLAVGSFGELTTNSTITVLPTIYGNDTVLFYHNGTKYNVLFLDGQGNPLNNTKVTFNINGVTYTRTTNENGTTAGLAINLNPGEYIITATNTANGEMHSNNITVLPTIESNNLVKYYRNASQFVVKALDKQGQASASQTVKFNINGVIYTKTTDDNGEAKLNINLAAGNSVPKVYEITTECNGCTVSNNITVMPVIIGEDLVLEYKSGEKYNVHVFDGQGNPQPNVNVTFNINGVNYYRTSDVNGTTTGLTINLLPGSYIITAIRDDNGATISNNIVVVNA